jgi:hypothetical protein
LLVGFDLKLTGTESPPSVANCIMNNPRVHRLFIVLLDVHVRTRTGSIQIVNLVFSLYVASKLVGLGMDVSLHYLIAM